MKLKGFSEALNTGSLELTLVSPQSVQNVTCDTCGFTSPDMFLGWCKHVYCSSCLFALEESNRGEAVLDSYCVLCKMDVFSMKLTVYESFIMGLRCFCPKCSIDLKLCELRSHLSHCRPTSASDDDLDLRLEPDTNVPPSECQLGEDDFSVVPKEPLTELPGTQAPSPEGMRVMISSTRRELKSNITRNEKRIAFLAMDLKGQECSVRNLREQTRKPNFLRLWLRGFKGDTKLFQSVPVGIANVIVTFVAFRKNDNAPGSPGSALLMYVEAITDGPERASLSVCVPGKTPSEPFNFETLPRFTNGDIKLGGAAHAFPNVFSDTMGSGQEVDLHIEYF